MRRCGNTERRQCWGSVIHGCSPQSGLLCRHTSKSLLPCFHHFGCTIALLLPAHRLPYASTTCPCASLAIRLYHVPHMPQVTWHRPWLALKDHCFSPLHARARMRSAPGAVGREGMLDPSAPNTPRCALHDSRACLSPLPQTHHTAPYMCASPERKVSEYPLACFFKSILVAGQICLS